MKRIVSLLFLVAGFCAASAQNLRLQVYATDSSLNGMKVYLKSFSLKGDTTVQLQSSGQGLSGEVPVSLGRLYQGFAANSRAQFPFPVYVPAGKQPVRIHYVLKEQCPFIDGDVNNRALSTFNAVVYKNSKDFWLHGAKWSVEQLCGFLKGYRQAADSLLGRYACTSAVKNYLLLWAYNETCNACEGMSHVTGKSVADLSFNIEDVWKDSRTLVDSPTALYFPAVIQRLAGSIKGDGLLSKLSELQKQYKNKVVQERVQALLLEQFIRTFNYAQNYEEGLEALQKATAVYGLGQKYLDDFKMRRATVKGVSFPQGITLTDVNGTKQDFSQFKGSYVYIDLWASWCVPCIKEVPYLQKLEKELQDKPVKFLSISLDQNEQSWKARMKALGMEGNQWLNKDEKLPESLNVKGIPFFLLYDKEGKLLQYNAPRPSDPALRTLLESLQ